MQLSLGKIHSNKKNINKLILVYCAAESTVGTSILLTFWLAMLQQILIWTIAKTISYPSDPVKVRGYFTRGCAKLFQAFWHTKYYCQQS